MRATFSALVAAAVLGLTSAASATDFANRFPAAYNWTGLYVGVNLGHASGTLSESPMPTGPFGDQLDTINPKGLFGGAQIGYNVQFGRFVAGLESDFQIANVSGDRTIDWCPGCVGFSSTENQSTKMPWFGTTRIRAGFTPLDRVLVYATGGVAYGKVRSTNAYTSSSPWWGTYSSTTMTDNFGVGPAIGAGVEWAFADNWTVKAEYLHLDLGLLASETTSTYGGSMSATRLNQNLFRVGLNYKF